MEMLIYVLITLSPAGDMILRHEVLPAATCAARLEALRQEAAPLKMGFCTRPGEAYRLRRTYAGS
jgi:hypothetical protein